MALQITCGLCSKAFSVKDRIYSNNTSKCGHIFHKPCAESTATEPEDVDTTVCPNPGCSEIGELGSRMGRNYAVEAILKVLHSTAKEDLSASRNRLSSNSTSHDSFLPMSQNAAKRRRRSDDSEASIDTSLHISRVGEDAGNTEDEIADEAEAILDDGTGEDITEETEADQRAFKKQEESRKEAWFSRTVDEYGAPPHSQYVRSSYVPSSMT